jgi:hypothetical protein
MPEKKPDVRNIVYEPARLLDLSLELRCSKHVGRSTSEGERGNTVSIIYKGYKRK